LFECYGTKILLILTLIICRSSEDRYSWIHWRPAKFVVQPIYLD